MEVVDEVRQKIFKMLEEQKLSYLEAVYLIMKVLPEVLGANTQWENFYDSFKEKEELDLEWTERIEIIKELEKDKSSILEKIKLEGDTDVNTQEINPN
jgi:hypothetical protein